MENLARVIYDRLRLPIDHYVTINMDGFVSVIDAIGGVEINVQESFTLEGVTFKPGLQTLNGLQAEKFVRAAAQPRRRYRPDQRPAGVFSGTGQ